ncbi:uncharacterized protein CLUP02_10973 [Colletotrichum lupini]|uniref:Zn(2)-C6 fungal-type domain-containing protein n=1 Tax=Colletotrichum lupini TaxID=145971 RepID=A0A9Q8WK22_9PEZI|nr:uncharacterized protein CLUP02_10973 [Colletotrichum lupini]UQC85475.1 hypothetical protein CLUP02_10973 [Colletotrichum lupini]
MPARPVTRGSKSGAKPPPPKGKPTAKTRTTASSAAPTKKVPRSRTFTGCRTCRSRHLKCDEARPVCSSCRRLNLVCEGYDGQLLWIPDPLCSAEQKHAHRGTSYRYPLFTEEERKTMCVEIVTSMGRQSAGDIVLDLDEKSVHADDAHVAGPFGVFRAFDGSTDSGSSPLQPSASGSSPNTSQSDALPETMNGELAEDIEDIGESDEPSQVKYNEILMAILATAMVSVLYKGSRAVKIFLLDAERLIRLRGLAMPKSFHVRVLHHVYTHLRVIAESTDIAIDSAKSQAQAATEMAVSLRKFRITEDSLYRIGSPIRPRHTADCAGAN